MNGLIVKRPEHESMTMMQTNLSNRLHTIASRTKINLQGRIEYLETYIGYMLEYRSRMSVQDSIDRCEGSMENMRIKIAVLKTQRMMMG